MLVLIISRNGHVPKPVILRRDFRKQLLCVCTEEGALEQLFVYSLSTPRRLENICSVFHRSVGGLDWSSRVIGYFERHAHGGGCERRRKGRYTSTESIDGSPASHRHLQYVLYGLSIYS